VISSTTSLQSSPSRLTILTLPVLGEAPRLGFSGVVNLGGLPLTLLFGAPPAAEEHRYQRIALGESGQPSQNAVVVG
jgi:hypothetical protein